MTVTLRPGTATAESAVLTTPAMVPPTGGCFAPAFTTGPGWHAAVRSADASNIHVNRMQSAVQGARPDRGSGFGVRGSRSWVRRFFWFWFFGSGSLVGSLVLVLW